MKKIRLLISVLFIILFLAGCGGGGDSSAPPAPTFEAEGLYRGTTATDRAAAGIILNDGTFYIVYSVENNPDVVAGVVQGNGTASEGSLSSSNAMDFNFEGLGVFPATVSATYSPKQWVDSILSYDNGNTVEFSTTYDTDYENTPSLADLAGIFTGEVMFSLGSEDAEVTISPTGAVSGVGASGCIMTGSVAPRASGNIYNVSITFGGAPCYFENQTMSGICYYDSNTRQLWAAAPNATRTEGIMFVGDKP